MRRTRLGDPFAVVASGELVFDALGTLLDPDTFPVVFDFSGGSASEQRVDIYSSPRTCTPTTVGRGTSALVTVWSDGQAALGECRVELVT